MRISDWSSDVCSSDLWTSCPRAVADGWRAIWYRWLPRLRGSESRRTSAGGAPHEHDRSSRLFLASGGAGTPPRRCRRRLYRTPRAPRDGTLLRRSRARGRSEEHTSELQSLMRISYAVFCLKKKKTTNKLNITNKLNTTQLQT